ncbi:MAG: biopolymer transporter ExbD [Polyangia bacterium]|jgi:biopolymer transport protein ExbD
MSDLDELLKNPPRLPPRKHRRHARHSIKNAGIRSEINVTPLVDVVLVLLIIFMVVTPMITRGMPVEQPVTRHHDKKNDSGEQIVVSVTCEGGKMGAIHWECAQSRMFVGSDLATDETLGELVQKEMRKGSGGREVHIKGDRRASYGAVRHAMELVNAVGVPQVHLGSEEYKEAN